MSIPTNIKIKQERSPSPLPYDEYDSDSSDDPPLTKGAQTSPPQNKTPTSATTPTRTATTSASSFQASNSQSGSWRDEKTQQATEIPPELISSIAQKIETIEQHINKHKKGRKPPKKFVEQIFEYASITASNMLPLEAVLGSLVGGEYKCSTAKLKEILKEKSHSSFELFISHLGDCHFFQNYKVDIDWIDTANEQDKVVRAYLQLVAYGLYNFLTTLKDSQLALISELVAGKPSDPDSQLALISELVAGKPSDPDSQLAIISELVKGKPSDPDSQLALISELVKGKPSDPETHKVDMQQIINYVLGEVKVVAHGMNCFNCGNPIFGSRYNCDQMASQNFCIQCARRIIETQKDKNEKLSFSVLREQVSPGSELEIDAEELHFLSSYSIDNNTNNNNNTSNNNNNSAENSVIVDSGDILQNMIAEVIEQLNHCVEDIEKAQRRGGSVLDVTLSERWRTSWRVQLEKLQQKANLPDVCIAVASPSGAGKSSLLNAILGEKILPTGCTSEACSSGAVEISYWPRNYYEAEVVFMTKEEWMTEQNALLHDAAESGLLSAVPLKTLKNIFGPDLPREKDDAAFKLQIEHLPCYVESHLGKTKKFQLKTSNAVRQVVKHFVTETSSQICLWPIVAKVLVRGPFIELSSGARLVDLPGMNDICEARIKLMNKYLVDSHYIWVLSNIERCATDARSKMLINEKFVTKLASNNMWASLCYIATKSDELTEEEVIDKLRLPPKSTPLTCALERNKYAKKCIQENLLAEAEEKLADLFADEECPVKPEDLAHLNEIKIFTVSAKNYMQLIGEDSTSSSVLRYFNIEQTEIPLLQKFLHDSTQHRGDYLNKILQELDKSFDSILNELSISVDKNASQKIQNSFSNLFSQFQRRLGVSQDFHKSVNQVLKVTVAKKLELIIEEYQKESAIAEITEPWEKTELRYNTIRATCARQGNFRDLNFNFDIGKRLLSGLIPQWNTFFNKIKEEILSLETKYEKMVADFHEQLGAILKQMGIMRATQNTFKIDFLDALLHHKVNVAKEKMDSERKSCCDLVEEYIKDSMSEAYVTTRETKGKGAKQRMIGNLMNAIKTNREMFQHTSARILQDMELVAVTIGELLEDVSKEIKNGLQKHYQIYWQEIQEKGPFELLIKELRATQKQRERKLETALNHETQQRQLAAAKRKEFQKLLDEKKKQKEKAQVAEKKKPIEEKNQDTDRIGAGKRKKPDKADQDDFADELDTTPTRKSIPRQAKKTPPETKKKKGSPSKYEQVIPEFFEAKPAKGSGTKAVVSGFFEKQAKASQSKSSAPRQDITLWSIDDVFNWVSQTQFKEYAQKFKSENVKGSYLPTISDEELKEIGIATLGGRREFRGLVAELMK